MPTDCKRCGRPLVPDDIGATKKLTNRGATEFYCISCLAEHFGTSEARLREKIEFWRKTGCMLFAKKKKDDQ